MDITTLKTSSTVLATGAPTPAVEAFTTGRAAAFMACTTNEMTMPAMIGTHWLLVKNEAGSETVTVCELVAAPKASPPSTRRFWKGLAGLLTTCARTSAA